MNFDRTANAKALVTPGMAGLPGVTIRSRGVSNALVFVARDVGALGEALAAAVSGESGNETAVTVEFLTAAESVVLPLPSGVGRVGWSLGASGSGAVRFRNPLSPGGPSPVRNLSVRGNRALRIVARDVSLPWTAPLGTVGVRITVGSTRGCALFDETAVVRDQPGTDFLARRRGGAALSDCSDASLCSASASTCGNGIIEASEQCDGPDAEPVASCRGDGDMLSFQCQADCTCRAFGACAVGGEVCAQCCPG